MRLAEQLLKEHKNNVSEVALIPSQGGVYEIKVNGQEVFSKKELGRFPDPDEVEVAVEKLI